MIESIRNKFPGMIELSEAVHKAIIECYLKPKSYVNNNLEGVIKYNREANPLDFLKFRCYARDSVERSEEEISEKYKEIASKVLAADGFLPVCFRELLLFSESYVIDIASNAFCYYNRDLFGDDGRSDTDTDTDID